MWFMGTNIEMIIFVLTWKLKFKSLNDNIYIIDPS